MYCGQPPYIHEHPVSQEDRTWVRDLWSHVGFLIRDPDPSGVQNQGLSYSWVAVKELDLRYHNSETMSFTISHISL